MRKILLFLFCCVSIFSKVSAQTTYYWVGAAGSATTGSSTTPEPGPTDWQLSTNWNTVPDKSGQPRTSPANNDILIFDGSIHQQAPVYLANIPSQTLGTLRLTNNANVNLMTISSTGGTSAVGAITSVVDYGGCVKNVVGSGFSNLKKGDFVFTTQALNAQVLAIKDDANMTISNDNALVAANLNKYATIYLNTLTIEAGSILNMAGNVTGTTFNSLALITQGGTIAGAVNFTSRGSYCKLYCTTPNRGSSTAGLHVTSGGSITYNTSTSGQKNYLLGQTLGLYDNNGTFIFDDGNGANNVIPGYTGNAGIVFDAGSTFTNTAGAQFFVMGSSFNANNTNLVFTPAVYFAPNSNYISNTGNINSAYFPTNVGGLRFGNIEFRNGLPITGSTVTSGTFNATVDNLTIAGTFAASSIAGNIFIRGNLTNTNTNTMTFTGSVFMTGLSNQTISSTNTKTLSFNNLIIADKAEVSLNNTISATNLHLVGKLNFGAQKVESILVGTATTSNLYSYAGPYSKISGVTAFTKGSNAISGINDTKSLVSAPFSYEFPIGASVSCGAILDSRTILRSYNTSGAGNISTLALSSVTTNDNLTATFSIQGSSFTPVNTDLTTLATGFSNVYTNINSSVLPLNILSFSGVTTLEGILLKLKTTDEVNVQNIIIEKQDINNKFSSIGILKPKSLAGLNSYTFLDKNPNLGTNYYRIKILDYDGSTTFSEIINVNVNSTDLSHKIKVYPNPISSSATVEYPSSSIKSSLKIFTINGRLIQQQEINVGQTNSVIDLSKEVSGLYLLEITGGDTKFTIKLIKN